MAAMRSKDSQNEPETIALGRNEDGQGIHSHQPSVTSRIDLEDLESLSLDLLRKRWRIVLGRPSPLRLPPKLMARILAWKMQVQETGYLTRAYQDMLERAGRRSEEHGSAAAKTQAQQPKALRTGTVLLREYAGVLHRVTVQTDGGFAWRAGTYRSLSEVARAITGTNWNGPRFFGLKIEARRERPAGRPADVCQGEGASP